MASDANRVLVYSSIGTNVVSIAAAVASIATAIASYVIHLPDGARPWAIALAGFSLAYLFRKMIPDSRTVPLPNVISMTVLAIATVLVAVVVVWPGRISPKPSPSNSLNATARQLAANIHPGHNANIGGCVRVTGIGVIPSGYGIWVANLKDINGLPDQSELFGLQHATEVNGQNAWSTNSFTVGYSKDVGKQFWIFVYLIPDSISTVLASISPPRGYAVSLKAPFKRTYLIDKIPVIRTAAACA